MRKILSVIMLSTVLLATACSTTNHDAGNPTVDIVLHWWRVETPPSTVTEFFACFGTTGLMLDQDDGNIANTPNDPMCPKNGTPYRLVTRHGSDPAINIGGNRIIPPDSTGTWHDISGAD